MREAKRIFVMLMIALAAGCSTHQAVSPPRAASHQAWVRSQGGLAPVSHADHLVDICRRRLGADTLAECQLHVLESEAAVAFAWPDRRIYLSRGLIACLTDEELTAAVAHELGHLLDDGHIDCPVTLAGDPLAPTDRESRADRLGVGLLMTHHQNPAAMITMLEKVRDAASTSAATRANIAERIARLR